MKPYKVYYRDGSLAGKTVAVSPSKAINNVRFKLGELWKPMSDYYAKEVRQ